MFNRDHIYTVHVNPDIEDPSERTVLVREGFSLWAFVFTVLWTLSHRLWLLSALYLVLTLLLIKGGERVELDDVTRGVLQLGLQVWLAFTANDARRDALERQGYTVTSVVCASSELLAEQRFYDQKTA